jgi:hypothetical protein
VLDGRAVGEWLFGGLDLYWGFLGQLGRHFDRELLSRDFHRNFHRGFHREFFRDFHRGFHLDLFKLFLRLDCHFLRWNCDL